jgi:hypothetical protein
MPVPHATMGFVGYVKYLNAGINGETLYVRATSASLNAIQNIDAPAVVDSKYDRTVYQIHPLEVGGNIAFPAIHEDGSGILAGLWNKTMVRDSSGRVGQFGVEVKYTDSNATFLYTDCIIDSFELSVQQSETFNVTTNLFGINREPLIYTDPWFVRRNSRIVTWNDAVLNIGGSGFSIPGSYFRNFTITVANNPVRVYTLNGLLTPQDVVPTKRDITGKLEVMGRHPQLAQQAWSNYERCTEDSTILFGYTLASALCNADWRVQLPGVVFQIEEMTLTNDLFITNVNWRCLPGVTYREGLGSETFVISA